MSIAQDFTEPETEIVDPHGTPDAPVSNFNVETTIRRLHAGESSAMDLPMDERHACVAHLTEQGFTSTEIASVLYMNERTVRRDRAGIRRDDAIAPDMRLGDELLGEYHRLLHAGILRLTRRANDRNEPAYVRLWAEEAILRMYQRFIETARKMNYLRDGEERVRHQVITDPAEPKRQAERFEANLKIHEATNPVPGMLRQRELFQTLRDLGIAKQAQMRANSQEKQKGESQARETEPA